ncbi:CDP-glycerol glycerophosphotransferase family protein [Cellulomonas edaphi]|uniref:CDP-glycerol glycerophosphotransferase family protein n=1 Tax=Cellulomonas edaphi TaxID=3053468 RepID=A0ABT7S816_9CELL|nr:CDP-glycerol glycerophosphotransferase family protein [Cellulomons edaphi]MDM7831765.1 CDP-glycerol glycerophosphotransferase family protein [Cellulomons edaphi]
MPLLRELSTLLLKARASLALVRDGRAVVGELRQQAPVAPGSIEAVVYFPDGAVNAYQVRQWYEPLRRLAETHPVAVIARRADAARLLLAECPLPVVLLSTMGEIETWLGTQRVGVIFYVNQNQANFAALRFAGPAHVFVSHGESEKAYMVSNQLKAYDQVFVAGPAAVRRIARSIRGLAPERLVEIGRPQVDVRHAGPDLPADDRVVVLYAPTWEGDRPSMEYSSLASHGAAMVAALVGDPRYRVVYRPHPRTGVQDSAYSAAHRAVVGVLAAANAADPAAAHVVDTDSPFGWHLAAADVCIADLSAVAYDWMATGKPLVLTRPAAAQATVEGSELAAAVPLLDAAHAGQVTSRIADLMAGQDDGYAALVRDFFGDTAPGASTARFLAAADALIAERASEEVA